MVFLAALSSSRALSRLLFRPIMLSWACAGAGRNAAGVREREAAAPAPASRAAGQRCRRPGALPLPHLPEDQARLRAEVAQRGVAHKGALRLPARSRPARTGGAADAAAAAAAGAGSGPCRDAVPPPGVRLLGLQGSRWGHRSDLVPRATPRPTATARTLAACSGALRCSFAARVPALGSPGSTLIASSRALRSSGLCFMGSAALSLRLNTSCLGTQQG